MKLACLPVPARKADHVDVLARSESEQHSASPARLADDVAVPACSKQCSPVPAR